MSDLYCSPTICRSQRGSLDRSIPAPSLGAVDGPPVAAHPAEDQQVPVWGQQQEPPHCNQVLGRGAFMKYGETAEMKRLVERKRERTARGAERLQAGGREGLFKDIILASSSRCMTSFQARLHQRQNSRVRTAVINKKAPFKPPPPPSYVRVRKSKRTINCGRLSVRTYGSKPRKSLRNSFQKVLKENTGSVKHIKSKKAAGAGPERLQL